MEIELKDVCKEFNGKKVLQGIDLSIPKGQFTALLGPSGCGKTTLLNALAGFLDIDGGEIVVGGQTWSDEGVTLAPEKRNVGMVFQDFALWPHLTVYENVAFGLKVKRRRAPEIAVRVQEVLATVQMEGYVNAYPHQLSGGQKQRIAIARALAPNPSVLLMDEPLSSLDAKLREQMRWDLLSIIKSAKITTVYVTHDQMEALSMADQIVLLHDGIVEQVGTPQELFDNPQTVFAAHFMGAANVIEAEFRESAENFSMIQWSGATLRVHGSPAHMQQPMVLFRPSSLRLSYEATPSSLHSSLPCIIQARAYHGFTWQYRVQVKDATRQLPQTVEVWSADEFAIGTQLFLHVPAESGRLVEGGETAKLTHLGG